MKYVPSCYKREGTGFDYAVGSIVRWEVTPPFALTLCSMNWQTFWEAILQKTLVKDGKAPMSRLRA